MGDEGSGLLTSPDGVAPSRIVGVSASDISPCTIKSRRRFLLALADLGSPRKSAVERLCVGQISEGLPSLLHLECCKILFTDLMPLLSPTKSTVLSMLKSSFTFRDMI